MIRRSFHLPLPPKRVTHVCIFEKPISDKSPAGWKNQLYILNSNTIWYMKIHVAKIPPWGEGFLLSAHGLHEVLVIYTSSLWNLLRNTEHN